MARRWLPTPLLLLSFGFIFSSSAIAQNNVVGQWSPVMTWPYEAIHAHVLPTGKVLWWTESKRRHTRTFWDPATNTNTCRCATWSKHILFRPDFPTRWQLLVAGGHVGNYVGIARRLQIQSVHQQLDAPA